MEPLSAASMESGSYQRGYDFIVRLVEFILDGTPCTFLVQIFITFKCNFWIFIEIICEINFFFD